MSNHPVAPEIDARVVELAAQQLLDGNAKPNYHAIERALGGALKWRAVRDRINGPLKARIHDEVEAARRHAAAVPVVDDPEARRREQAKNDAVLIGVDEVRVVRASQQNGMAGLAAVNAALQASFRQLVVYRASIEKKTPQELEKLCEDPKQVDRMHKNAAAIAAMGHHIAQVAKLTMEMERMRVGKPVAVMRVELTDKTSAQIQKELQAALLDLQMAEAQGLDAPEGTAAPPLPPSIPFPGTAAIPASISVADARPSGWTAGTTLVPPLADPVLGPLDPPPRMSCCGSSPMLRNGSDGNPLHLTLFCPACRRMIYSQDGGRNFVELPSNILPITATTGS